MINFGHEYRVIMAQGKSYANEALNINIALACVAYLRLTFIP